MSRTKIPPAITKEEVAEQLIKDVGALRYVVEDAATRQILATGLTKRQTIDFTWLHDGRDYEIKPRLGILHDDNGMATEITHQLSDAFGIEWDVYFKSGPDQPWRKSRITAYGANERIAILDLVDQGFARQAWSDAFYVRQIGLSDIRAMSMQLDPVMAKRMAVGA